MPNLRIQTRTHLCVLINAISFGFLLVFVLLSADLGQLARVGPSDDLVILSAKIDTWNRYIALLVVVGLFKMVEVLVQDIGSPALGFSIYNPTATIVYGFTYRGLAFAANVQWLISSFSRVFQTLVIVSRFDVAVFSVLISEVVSGGVVHYLLQAKTFRPEADTEDEWKALQATDLEMGIVTGGRL